MASAPFYTVIYVENRQAEQQTRTAVLREAGYRVLQAIAKEEGLLIAEREGLALLLLQDVGGSPGTITRIWATSEMDNVVPDRSREKREC